MNLKDQTGGSAPYLSVPFLGCTIYCKVKLLIFETRPNISIDISIDNFGEGLFWCYCSELRSLAVM